MPRPFNGQVAVHWLRSADGTWYGRDYHNQTPLCHGGFNSKARQVAQKGTIGWHKSNGHPLKGDYEGLFMLRATSKEEFFGFRYLNVFYVTNGGKKKPGKRGQIPDYNLALRIKREFFEAIKEKK